MASGWRVLELFLENPESVFSVSDVMRRLKISWCSANDNMLSMVQLGLISREEKGYKLIPIIRKT